MWPPFYHPRHAKARSVFCRLALLRAVVFAFAVAGASPPAWARSIGHAAGHHADETLDPLEPDDTETDTAAAPDDPYGAYLGFKRQLKDDIHFEYSVVMTVLPQWGSPKGGPGVSGTNCEAGGCARWTRSGALRKLASVWPN
jgi:hypothetical protein